MSEEQKYLIDKLDEVIDMDTLEKTTFENVKRPLVFGKTDRFVFNLKEKGAYILPETKTKVGTQDMYILISDPKIYCFRHALKQLETFVNKNKIKLPTDILYSGREGEGFETVYNFGLVK